MARLTASTLAASPDFEKLIVCDWELARQLEAETWTATGAGSWYLSFTDGEVHRVFIGTHATGTETTLAEKFAVADVDDTTSSFYFDIANQRLYVHPPGDDSPATPNKYCVMAYFYLGIANTGVGLTRYRELLADGKLDLWTDASTLTYWTKSITGTAALDREYADVYNADSAYSAKLSVGATSSEVYIFQLTDRIVRPGAACLIRLKYKCADGSSTLKLMVRDSDSNQWLKSDGTWQGTSNVITIANATAWTEYSLSFNAHADYSSYFFILAVNENGHTVYVDNVEFKRYYKPRFFAPYLSGASIPAIRHSVGTFRDPSESLSFGTVTFNDDGFFAEKYGTYVWDNKEFKVFLGAANAAYDDLAPMFTGVSRRPTLQDGSFSVDIADSRAEYRNLLQKTFTAATYANCEDAWKEKPVPILFGDVHGFQPPQSNTAGRIYTLSQTAFGGTNNHAVPALNAVYINNNAGSANNDYTFDGANGQFTVLTGTANDTVTCDATGYTSNHEYWLYRMLVEIQGVPEDSINIKSLTKLGEKRVLTLARWYSSQKAIREAIGELKSSAQYFFFTRADGEYFARVLEEEIDANAQRYYDEDLSGFESWIDPDQSYGSVTMQYYAATDLNNQRYAVSAENSAKWERGIRQDLTLDMLETTDTSAARVAGAYSDILKRPLEMVRVTLPAPALFLEPTDKFYLTKTLVDADGTTRTVYNGEVFIVLELERNLNNLTATVTAVKSDRSMYWTASGYELALEAGSYEVVMPATESLTNRVLQAGAGSYAVTGSDVTLGGPT